MQIYRLFNSGSKQVEFVKKFVGYVYFILAQFECKYFHNVKHVISLGLQFVLNLLSDCLILPKWGILRTVFSAPATFGFHF